jgi:hypothetical protein
MLSLVLIIGNALGASLSCSRYGCNSATFNATFTGDNCLVATTNAATGEYDYHIKPCESNSMPYCAVTTPELYDCIAAIEKSISAYPGEKCSVDDDCVPNVSKCSSGYCTGLAKSAGCSDTIDCAPGLYCNSTATVEGMCNSLLTSGSDCSQDSDCDYSLGCFSNMCATYYSQANGNSCDSSRDDECSSNACVESECQASVQSNYTNPMMCDEDDDCPSTTLTLSDNSTYIVNATCSCGYNLAG